MSSLPRLALARFAGPLDLLLELVHRNEFDLTDLPIAEITHQYLAYLQQAEEFQLELGVEFVTLAAQLIHIKSRMLLPSDPALNLPDPRQELARQLLDHEQLRRGTEFLRERLGQTPTPCSRWEKFAPQESAASPDPDAPGPADDVLNLPQVLALARRALEAARTYSLITPSPTVEVDELIAWLEDRLASATSSLDAQPLFTQQPDASHRMALFLALLELARTARIDLQQEECFGPLLIAQIN